MIISKFNFILNKTSVNLNSTFKLYENQSIIYDNILNTIITKSLLNKFNILNINNKTTTFYLKNDLNSLFNKFDIIINLEDKNLFNNNNDILLNYLDNINNLKTQLNLFNLYNCDEVYLYMMYDFTDFVNSKDIN